MKLFCNPVRAPSLACPSTVRMVFPLNATAGTTQVGLVKLDPSGSSMITAQLRHCAAPQPNLVPVSPRYSRRKSFIVSSSRTSIGPCGPPLIVMLSVVTSHSPEHGRGHRQRLDAASGRIEDRVEDRRHDGN